MAMRESLGEFELLTMLAIVHLREEAYGTTIRDTLRSKAGRDVSVGALYATLHRLENKGLTKSHSGEPTCERGGRAKRFFEVTESGKDQVNQSLASLRGLTDAISVEPGFI
jgi:PadR family transcriptional regulator PadR